MPFCWWGLVTLAITLVLAAERVNSSIEALAEHLHPAIGKVKDMAAGMVLIMSVAAVIVGIQAMLSAV